MKTVSATRVGFLLLLSAGVVLMLRMAYAARPVVEPAPRAVTAASVADEAKAYLRQRNVTKLSGDLADLLARPERFLVKTQAHPLLGKAAPNFQARDHTGKPWKLSDHLADGPVVLIFYFGYHCDHCVGQLFAVHEDIQLFRELGAQVVAVSADAPADTQARFRQYGAFAFPVLSDPGYPVARAYGMLEPPKDKQVMVLLHGTFVIDRDGMVRWCQFGDEPFTGNRTLLYEVARGEGLLP